MTKSSYPHLIPSVTFYFLKECQWRGIDDESMLNNISVCADEILTNALTHGNKGSAHKNVSIVLSFDAEKFSLTVQDEGEGFEAQEYSRQMKQDQLDIPAKRGLFIVEYLTDNVSFNERGNEVTITLYLNGSRAKAKGN